MYIWKIKFFFIPDRLLIILILVIFCQIIIFAKGSKILNSISEINMVVTGTGEQQILFILIYLILIPQKLKVLIVCFFNVAHWNL